MRRIMVDPHYCWRSPLPVRLVGVLRRVRVAQRAQAGGRGGGLEGVPAVEVDVPVLQRREPGHVLVLEVLALVAELGDGGVQGDREKPWERIKPRG
jgi:hypothetical protein